MVLNSRKDIEQREKTTLAAYAARSAESRGRVYPSKEHKLRTCFQRDRDRIIHSAAFRRMEYKTQVFLPHEGDHFRTRLTHTIEVAQIARTMARNLGLNEDLTEAVALVHDLGHTPFGHCGEDVLDELIKASGGFNHNRQSLRVVDILEQRYQEHPGLNLTYEVREGIVKHETKTRITHPDFDPESRPTLEAALVDIADELAYNAHDIDDGLYSGILKFEDIRELSIWPEDAGEKFHSLTDDQLRYSLIRLLINRMASDVIEETEKQLEKLSITSLEDIRHASEKICSYSDSMALRVGELKKFLKENLYLHVRLVGMHEKAEKIIEILFHKFKQNPNLMPDRFQEMLLTEKVDIVIADYIAGMTDRYAEKLFDKLS